MGMWLGAAVIFILAFIMGYGITITRRYGHRKKGEEPSRVWRIFGGAFIGGITFYLIGYAARRSYLDPLWQQALALGVGLGVFVGLTINVRWRSKES